MLIHVDDVPMLVPHVPFRVHTCKHVHDNCWLYHPFPFFQYKRVYLAILVNI